MTTSWRAKLREEHSKAEDLQKLHKMTIDGIYNHNTYAFYGAVLLTTSIFLFFNSKLNQLIDSCAQMPNQSDNSGLSGVTEEEDCREVTDA